VLPADEEILFRALRRKDVRFDGRFFVGVTSTGIYCRPVCPARAALRKNLRFYEQAAAAEAAGFRPCRRCRPETAPGSPPWLGPAAVVGRALRLLEHGASEEGLAAFASRFGVGERQLRRLFVRHLGASPGQILRTRRIHFAKQLVVETAMPLTEVALAAGFRSVRQFNAAYRETFRRTPTEARRGKHAGAADAPDATLELRLPYRPPLAWRELLGFIGARAIPGVEAVTGDGYRRTFDVEGRAGVLEVRPSGDEGRLSLSIRGGSPRALAELVRRLRRQLDLDADPVSIGEQLGRSPMLAPLLRARPGLRVLRAFEPFETLVRVVLGQQISVRAATTLSGRLVERFGAPFAGDPDLTRLFPEPADLQDAPLEEIGLPASRAEALRALARQVLDGTLPLDGSAELEELVQRLCAAPGIGPWTAHTLAMRVAGEPDAFPASDLVLRQVGGGAGRDPVSAAELEALAEPWRPFRAYAAMHLWTHAALDGEGHANHPVAV
jgi:AraC family transcriptional regulator of adaptative response / DNA-3-methyladenine glycosylase II